MIAFTALDTAGRPASGSDGWAGASVGVDTGSWAAQTFELSSAGFTSKGDAVREAKSK